MDAMDVFINYVTVWTMLGVCCVGVITNSINISVFFKQGFHEGATISMTFLSFWSLFKCICGIGYRLGGPVGLVSPALGLTWKNITLPYVEFTGMYAGYVSFALAAFISIERCLCVSKPFTAKKIITPKVTLTVLLSISVVASGAYIVVYFMYDIQFEYSQIFNTSVAKYIHSNFYDAKSDIVMSYYQVMAILIPTSGFFILTISSTITVHYLRKSTQFLKHKTDHKLNNPVCVISNREKQVVKTLLAVILVYIINLFPRLIFYIAQLWEPEFQLLRKYNKLFVLVAASISVFDFSNASIHFFIYYNMSSGFRNNFFKACTVVSYPRS
ncbi:uncharacterized protein LOC131939058 [Physella acuta]|uniref:uncharacterized protein LOC131939058 n=1 Tax=Physella acuta TaxID=109671 RepID=UPI0027DC8010|nr:uncharacterized protein LOC131939058 [Physella acuta]